MDEQDGKEGAEGGGAYGFNPLQNAGNLIVAVRHHCLLDTWSLAAEALATCAFRDGTESTCTSSAIFLLYPLFRTALLSAGPFAHALPSAKLHRAVDEVPAGT